LIGIKVGSSVSKNTFAVIVKSLEEKDTGKTLDAKKCGVQIVLVNEFREKYNV
jgi:NAD-dependent DNA ligase